MASNPPDLYGDKGPDMVTVVAARDLFDLIFPLDVVVDEIAFGSTDAVIDFLVDNLDE
jgi:hypothetical protein